MAKDKELEFCLRAGKTQPYKPIALEIFEQIEGAITNEKHLLPVEARYLKFSYEEGCAVVVLDGEKPVAYTRLASLLAGDDGWWELGTTWVHREYRDRGINKRMYSMLLPWHECKNILATTTNPTSLEVGACFGFVRIPRRLLPEKIWKYSCCCPATKTGASLRDNSDCRLAHGESQSEGSEVQCWMRVTKPTADRHSLIAQAA